MIPVASKERDGTVRMFGMFGMFGMEEHSPAGPQIYPSRALPQPGRDTVVLIHGGSVRSADLFGPMNTYPVVFRGQPPPRRKCGAARDPTGPVDNAGTVRRAVTHRAWRIQSPGIHADMATTGCPAHIRVTGITVVRGTRCAKHGAHIVVTQSKTTDEMHPQREQRLVGRRAPPAILAQEEIPCQNSSLTPREFVSSATLPTPNSAW